MAEIKIDDTAMKDIVAKAILDSVTDEQRDEILKAAVTNLITPPPSTGMYGGRKEPSPLQNAFDIAVRSVGQEVVNEMVKGELRDKIREMVKAKVSEIIEDDSNLAYGVGQSVGQAIESAMRGDRG
jgi:hypothetical protein